MNTIHHVEMVIHVDETLNEVQRNTLIENLMKHDGIEKARFTNGREHLMVIDYDSNKLNTAGILALVRQEDFHAELIGI